MAQEEKVFKAPEQKKAEEKPVEAQKEEEDAKERKHEAIQQKAHDLEKKEAGAKPEAKKDGEDEDAPKREVVLSRVVTASLGEAYKKPLNSRGNYAVRLLRQQIARGFKVTGEFVKIDPAVSNLVFARSGRKPPRHLKLACSLDKEGVVVVEPA